MNAVISPEHSVSVTTYSRLHLGFFDLSGQSQRRFGSMGVAIDAFRTTLTVSNQPYAKDPDPWPSAVLQRHLQTRGIKFDINLDIQQAIPRHSGLGSGTQMALAIGAGVDTLIGRSVEPTGIAVLHQRGARSGIGIGTFEYGGLVVDGGRGPTTTVPPLLARFNFPMSWHFLLIMDQGKDGLHGAGEKSAFKTLPNQSVAATQKIHHLLVAQGLPALAEHDFEAFSDFVGNLQTYNADYFSPSQGGAYASPSVAAILKSLKQEGHLGLGQTSWGPTGFVLFSSKTEAEQKQAALLAQYANEEHLSFIVTAAVNAPASVEVTD